VEKLDDGKLEKYCTPAGLPLSENSCPSLCSSPYLEERVEKLQQRMHVLFIYKCRLYFKYQNRMVLQSSPS
jgi:hypothetical protein